MIAVANVLGRLRRDERGVSMLVVVFLTSVLSVVSISLFQIVDQGSSQSAVAVQRQEAYSAAEAGIEAYLDKLVQNPVFYSQDLAPGEASRQSGGTTVAGSATANVTWSLGQSWTYPNGKDVWRTLGNGYEYDLQVTPPTSTQTQTTVLATGRKTGTTTNTRIIQVMVRPSLVTDFQMLADADIQYGSAATTNGLIYAGTDSSGVSHGVGHQGTASKNIYAEGCIGTTVSFSTHTCSGSGPNLTNGAKLYPSSTIRTVIKTPINFDDFLTSLTDIQRASQTGTGANYLNNTGILAWKLVFQSGGTYTVQQCTGTGDPAATAPTCGSVVATNTVPTNGAIYSPQTVIVSGTVKGRVTVASNNDIVVADNLLTNDGHCTNQSITATDAIGLVAAQNVHVAHWVPTNLTWCAATLAQGGEWASVNDDSSHGTMTFIGSTATRQGGHMSLFTTRVYNYDAGLTYLPPPWFPSVGQAYTITLFRELAAP